MQMLLQPDNDVTPRKYRRCFLGLNEEAARAQAMEAAALKLGWPRARPTAKLLGDGSREPALQHDAQTPKPELFPLLAVVTCVGPVTAASPFPGPVGKCLST